MKFKVQLNSMEDAAKLVNRLEYYDYQADAEVGSHVIDARSLLGLLGFGLGRVLTLIIYADSNENLREDIHELLVA